MTDTIADMLTRIRNGQRTRLMYITVPYSGTKTAILDVLKEEGYIASYKVSDLRAGVKEIEVMLKYSSNGGPAIKEITRVSKPGKRSYTAIDSLRGYYNGMGIYVLSTSKGVISDREARRENIGGEILCKVF
jgi:small subunit ribosomal protein S8